MVVKRQTHEVLYNYCSALKPDLFLQVQVTEVH